jgi:hypothetical protein
MKTGGTSFAFHAQQHFASDEIYPSPGIDTLDGSIDARILAYSTLQALGSLSSARRGAIRFYAGHFPFAATALVRESFADSTTSCAPIVLTLVREPVARTVSTLRHFQRLRPGSVGEARANRFAALPLEAIYDDPAVHSTFVRDHQVRLYSTTLADATGAFGSRSPYHDVAARLDGTDSSADPLDATWTASETARRHALAIALANLRATDLVGTDDGYDRFIAELRTAHGWWPRGIDTSARANASQASEPVATSFRRRIEADNAADLEFYETARELAAARLAESRR